MINPLSPIRKVCLSNLDFNLSHAIIHDFVSCGIVFLIYFIPSYIYSLLYTSFEKITTGLLLLFIIDVIDVNFFFLHLPPPYPTSSIPYLLIINVLSIYRSSVILYNGSASNILLYAVLYTPRDDHLL
jgi:hypothetical protein